MHAAIKELSIKINSTAKPLNITKATFQKTTNTQN